MEGKAKSVPTPEPPEVIVWDYYHRPTITVEKAHNCLTCGHGSDTVSEMVAHELEVHLHHRAKYGCGHCRIYFPSKVELIRHKMMDCPTTPKYKRKKNRAEIEKADEEEREKIIEAIKTGKIQRHPKFLKTEKEEETTENANFLLEEEMDAISLESTRSEQMILQKTLSN
ncbi:Oidioi.mRNA.OKI2018_I69.chr2.g7788.t1.cds [Oikopleura dioica]|uniref:Oidioi.mRNA.OKI2018_I69.chr2.g7788.t1.cds n=1 Tax=Oikopleura dioica TaxID=34765 RepID=A0ABN7TDQ5_OIKDI|nr:Oidioi.mRNA.OKI2018_I69.chr2.g7788.t1.cds [Oikopleura dioica]